MAFSEPVIPYFQSTSNILATPETNCLSSERDIHKGNKSDEGCEEGAVQDWWGGVIRPLQIILSINDKILVKICRNFFQIQTKSVQRCPKSVQNVKKLQKFQKLVQKCLVITTSTQPFYLKFFVLKISWTHIFL